jgi:glutathione S-transferase
VVLPTGARERHRHRLFHGRYRDLVVSTGAVAGGTGAMHTKLYVIPTHPCRTGMLMLEHKGIPYRRVDLPAGLHPLALKLLGFPGNKTPIRRIDDRPHRVLALADRMGTVPTLRAGDHWVATNRDIARFLEGVQPDPPLFPAERGRRLAVEEAERWGDEVFQMAARRLVLAASLRGLDGLVNRAESGRLGPLVSRHATARFAVARVVARFAFAVNAQSEPDLLAALPGMLDRIDGWIEDGVLNGEHLYAADYMIVTSLALLCYRPDLPRELERRPAIQLIDRVLPEP